jgi:hypothetical protein
VTTAAAGPLAVRVTLADTWETHTIVAGASESVGAVKRIALATAHIDPARASRYDVKFGGALVRDESTSLAALGAQAGTSLVVLSRRRRPVR